MDKFREIDHTADFALEIFGGNLSELFIHAAEGMYSAIFGREVILTSGVRRADAEQSSPFVLTSFSVEELLVEWLSELLYLLETEDIIPLPLYEVSIAEKPEETHLRAKLCWNKYARTGLIKRKEVKAVTYHNLKIVRGKNLMKAVAVFDL